ncbi:MAG TPA: hypothetical protein VGE01_12505 [Fimbriimonas sp.]
MRRSAWWNLGILALGLFAASCADRAPDPAPKPSKDPEAASADSGPGKPAGAAEAETEKERKPSASKGIELPKTVNASPGQATRLGPPPKRSKLWTVRWKGARIDFGDEGRFSGYMERVTGSIYDDFGKEASTFQGQAGQADKAKDILRLSGQVKVVSKQHKASLFCDKVEYQPDRKVIRAVGNVRIVSDSGTLDAGNEILATPDLRRVATPNLF